MMKIGFELIPLGSLRAQMAQMANQLGGRQRMGNVSQARCAQGVSRGTGKSMRNQVLVRSWVKVKA